MQKCILTPLLPANNIEVYCFLQLPSLVCTYTPLFQWFDWMKYFGKKKRAEKEVSGEVSGGREGEQMCWEDENLGR